jgi:hypothetical protein
MNSGELVMARVTPELENRLAAAVPGQELDLVLEMTGDAPPPPPGRATPEYIDSMRNAFSADVESVHRLVEGMGGAIMGENWLNRALKIRMPAERVSELLHSPEIDVIDIPHRLTRA